MKTKLTALLLILSLLLGGCGTEETTRWPAGYTVIAPFLAAEPVESYEFGESDDLLGLAGVYYAAWTNSDPREFVNSKGETTNIYNSQIYVVAQESGSPEEARTLLDQWMAREKQNYQVDGEQTLTLNGQDYTLLTLVSGSEDNPYGFGIAAFAVMGSNAVCVELVCSDTFTGMPQAVMEDFLDGLHYSE